MEEVGGWKLAHGCSRHWLVVGGGWRSRVERNTLLDPLCCPLPLLCTKQDTGAEPTSSSCSPRLPSSEARRTRPVDVPARQTLGPAADTPLLLRLPWKEESEKGEPPAALRGLCGPACGSHVTTVSTLGLPRAAAAAPPCRYRHRGSPAIVDCRARPCPCVCVPPARGEVSACVRQRRYTWCWKPRLRATVGGLQLPSRPRPARPGGGASDAAAAAVGNSAGAAAGLCPGARRSSSRLGHWAAAAAAAPLGRRPLLHGPVRRKLHGADILPAVGAACARCARGERRDQRQQHHGLWQPAGQVPCRV